MKLYLQTLIFMMLFVLVVEMIFPDSSFKKYLKLVLGCILVYTLITPLLVLLPSRTNRYENYVIAYKKQLGGMSDSQRDYQYQLDSQQNTLKTCYEKSVKSYIEGHFEVEVEKVHLRWGQAEAAGTIESLEMVIKPKQEKMGTIHLGEKSETLQGEEESIKNKIKNSLNSFYNVQVCNIHITVQKN